MSGLSEQEMLKKLKRFNTPSVANVVATYSSNPLCLGLYAPWKEKWYTNQSIHCIFPELGRTIGYAVTVVYSLPDPNYTRLSMADLVDAIAQSKKPVIVVHKQDFPPEILDKAGNGCGGIMATRFKACGVVGVLTNGPVRDVDEMRPMKFQCLASGITPAHGPVAISAINVPVSIAGMNVAPGELVHMDENGACKFPADRLADVCKNIDGIIEAEKKRIDAINAAKTIEEIKAAGFGG